MIIRLVCLHIAITVSYLAVHGFGNIGNIICNLKSY